jgi:hypothetical protein
MWKYNISTNQWSWENGLSIADGNAQYGTLNVPDPSNSPSARYGLTMSLLDSGRVLMFGGLAIFGSSWSTGYTNDLWLYDFAMGTGISSPTQQAQNLVASAITATSAQLTCTKGTGTKRLMVIRKSPLYGTNPLPANVAFTPNTVFGNGQLLATGVYAIYADTGNSVVVTNLQPNSTYSAAVFEYNQMGSTFSYLITPIVSTTFTTTLSSGVGQMPNEIKFAAWPNPFSGDIQVQLPQNADNLIVSDMFGRHIQTITHLQGGSRLSLGSNLAPGIYLLQSAGSNIRVIKTN